MNLGFSLRKNFEFVQKLIPVPYGFLETDISTIRFLGEGELEVELSHAMELGDGFIVPKKLVQKKIFPIIGISGLLMQDYLNDSLGSFGPSIEALVQESIMRNIRHFVFYIPSDSAEVVDVLPMFDKDLKPLAEDHTDLQLNYDTLTPLPYLKGLLAECSENGEIESCSDKFDDVFVSDISCDGDKFEMSFSPDIAENNGGVEPDLYCELQLKMPVSSMSPSQIIGNIPVKCIGCSFTLPQNFAKGKYSDKSAREVYDYVCKFMTMLREEEKDWSSAYKSMLDWDKCTGKVWEFLSGTLGLLFASDGGENRCTIQDIYRSLHEMFNEASKLSVSFKKNIGKCLGYMLVWQAFGCRTCEHLPD